MFELNTPNGRSTSLPSFRIARSRNSLDLWPAETTREAVEVQLGKAFGVCRSALLQKLQHAKVSRVLAGYIHAAPSGNMLRRRCIYGLLRVLRMSCAAKWPFGVFRSRAGRSTRGCAREGPFDDWFGVLG